MMAFVEEIHGGECSWFMYSPIYSWAWGCRCCRDGATLTYHTLWDLHGNPTATARAPVIMPDEDCKMNGESAAPQTSAASAS